MREGNVLKISAHLSTDEEFGLLLVLLISYYFLSLLLFPSILPENHSQQYVNFKNLHFFLCFIFTISSPELPDGQMGLYFITSDSLRHSARFTQVTGGGFSEYSWWRHSLHKRNRTEL